MHEPLLDSLRLLGRKTRKLVEALNVTGLCGMLAVRNNFLMGSAKLTEPTVFARPASKVEDWQVVMLQRN